MADDDSSENSRKMTVVFLSVCLLLLDATQGLLPRHSLKV